MNLQELGEPDLRIAGLDVWIRGREREHAHDWSDGNWLRAIARCSSEGATATVTGSFLHLGDLVPFLDECERLSRELKGEARLLSTEENLGVVLSMRPQGQMEAEVQITPDLLSQQHTFRFSIDQSYLNEIVAGINGVLRAYPVRGHPSE